MKETVGLARRRQARWAVPAGAVAAVGLVIAGSVIAGAQAAPRLPARTTAQLLAAADRPAALPSAMTAVVQETASLGLPDLPGSSDPLSALSLLSGTHTFKIWYNGPAQVRVAIPVSLGETDLRRDGRNAWLWDSQTNQATHYLLPAPPARPARLAAPGSGSSPGSPASDGTSFAGLSAGTPTPQQVAHQILAAVGKTTTVGTQQDVTVAGQAAYQLTLAPKDSRSLVGQVRIAIDARDSLPLRVLIFARGAASPAFDVEYTSLSFARPAASNFSFSPPPGAKVKTVTVPASPAGPLSSLAAERATGNQVGAVRHCGGRTGYPPASTGSAAHSSASAVSAVSSGSVSSGSVTSRASALAAPTVLGQGWLSVAVLPAAQPGGPAQGIGPGQGIISALETAATPVHGSWGSGRLLRTSLLSVLLTDSGQILIGAVRPAVLYADAAQSSRG